MSVIQIPYKFTPRPYQLELLRAMDSNYKRAVVVYHRRAGKDKTLFNLTIKKALERIGTYYYFFPEFAQGRRVIWQGFDGSGMRFLDHIPLVENGIPQHSSIKLNSTEMKIELMNGSVIQIIGTDKFDKVRGANPVGCVFSEYAFQNPEAWNVVRPILLENGGWAVFNSTPFGKNHFYDLYEMAKEQEDWFTQLITVEDSLDEFGNRFVSEKLIEEERLSGASEELIQQEYYCSFTANSEGYYYLEQLQKADEEGRIGLVPHLIDRGVDTWWDIGYDDNTAIWFTQIDGKDINVIDFYQNRTKGLDHYAKELQRRPYIYNSMNFPHDMKKTEYGTERSLIETAETLFPNIRLNILPKLGFQDGVQAVRLVLPRCRFHEVNCAHGLKCLQNYHREWDSKRMEFKQTPVHDWASDAADAFRYLATGLSLPREKSLTKDYIKRYRRFSQDNWKAL